MAKKLLIYISGPMTGIEDSNKPAFDKAEKHLVAMGYTVLNPARQPAGLTWGQYMKLAEVGVSMCDIICQLPGWEESKGALIEYTWAKEHSKMAIDSGLLVGGGI